MKFIYILLLLLITIWNTHAQQIDYMEYFIDTDPGLGEAIPITGFAPANNFELEFTAKLDGYTQGGHILYIRARNTTNEWSLVMRRAFLVQGFVSSAITDIVSVEYFIDSDKGFGQNTVVPIAKIGMNIDTTLTIDLSEAGAGPHILYMRTLDKYNTWSPVMRRVFIKDVISESTTDITELRYYYVDGENVIGEHTYEIPVPAPIVDMEFPAKTEGLVNGKPYIMYIWALDENNNRSLINTLSFQYQEADPIAIETDVTSVTCTGAENGAVTITASGGTSELLYSISTDSANYTSANVFENLAAGTYTAYVRGNVDNYVESQSFTITAPEPIVLETIDVQGVACASDADGSIEVIASGGAGEGYSYSINDSEFQENPVFDDLIAGTYTITVRDTNGCTAVLEVTVEALLQAPVPPTVRRSDESDHVEELSLIAEGVGSGMELQWYKDNEPIPGATNSEIPITEAGNYYAIANNGSCVSLPSNEISITGWSEMIAKQIKLYPVPANNSVKLEIPPQLIQGDFSIQLISSSGQILSNVAAGDNRQYFDRDVDISVLPQGIYFMMLRGEDVVVRKKFSKQ